MVNVYTIDKFQALQWTIFHLMILFLIVVSKLLQCIDYKKNLYKIALSYVGGKKQTVEDRRDSWAFFLC